MASANYKKPVSVSRTAFSELDLGKVVSTLIEDGVYLGLQLPSAQVSEIVAFAKGHPCFTKDAPQNGFLPADYEEANTARERDILAAFYFETAGKCSTVTALAQDEALYSIASAYLGEPAILMRTRLWWSFPATRISDHDLHLAAQNRFHFDIDGWRTLKFFFYLTPTDEGAGPHQYIRASHRRRKLRHQFTPTTGRPTAELEDFYAPDEFVTITGDAGFGFVEDPFVFHTGTLCQTRPRLMLEIGFGVSAANPAYKKPDFIYGRLG